MRPQFLSWETEKSLQQPIFEFPKVPRKLRKLSVLLDEPDESKTLATSASQVGCVGPDRFTELVQ